MVLGEEAIGVAFILVPVLRVGLCGNGLGWEIPTLLSQLQAHNTLLIAPSPSIQQRIKPFAQCNNIFNGLSDLRFLKFD